MRAATPSTPCARRPPTPYEVWPCSDPEQRVRTRFRLYQSCFVPVAVRDADMRERLQFELSKFGIEGSSAQGLLGYAVQHVLLVS